MKKPLLPKPTSPPPSFSSAISHWTGGRLSPHSGFYAGRGPLRGDLGPDHLDLLFEGIKKDFSPQHAAVFVEFVQNLTDLSASAFLVAFEYFWNSRCSDANGYKQQSGDSVQISAHDDAGRFAEGMCAIFSVLGRKSDPEYDLSMSHSIKREFLNRHGATCKALKTRSNRDGFYYPCDE